MNHVHDPLCPVATVYDAMGDRPAAIPDHLPKIDPPRGPSPRWFAKTDVHTVIATGDTFTECNEAARKAMPWRDRGVAPYYLTTIAPDLPPAMMAEGNLTEERR